MCPVGGASARNLLEERPLRRIITFCSDVDQVLGGGIALGQLTEFCKFIYPALSIPALSTPRPGLILLNVTPMRQYCGIGSVSLLTIA